MVTPSSNCTGANVAETVRACDMVTTHVVEVPEHTPTQPWKELPEDADAVRVTLELEG